MLDAGIDVISTVNIQHLESLNDVVERITGVPQRETVPDEVVRRADQQELVDMTPYALRRRMAHGNIYPPEKIDAALSNYFREGNLDALRELALLWMADRVDEALQDYMKSQGIEGPWETRERILVGVAGRGGRGADPPRRPAWRSGAAATLVAVHVIPEDGLREPPALDESRELVTGARGVPSTRSSGRASRGAPRLRARGERHADHRRRLDPVPLAPPHPRVGDQPHHPRVGADRRARDLTRLRARGRRPASARRSGLLAHGAMRGSRLHAAACRS